jgi:hypothetical protein
MNLPISIQAYFDAANNNNLDSAVSLFEDDMTIHDTGEDTTICGIDNCRQWIVDINRRYEKKTTVLSHNEIESGVVVVSTQVTGNFSKDAFLFDYTFVLKGGKIASINIVYVGQADKT